MARRSMRSRPNSARSPLAHSSRPTRALHARGSIQHPRGSMLDLLKGIRVVSFNHFLLGPMGVQALGDLGADVIAVEATEGSWARKWASGNVWPDGQSALHVCANRNKRSLALDLKSAKGREIALRLIDTADVIA